VYAQKLSKTVGYKLNVSDLRGNAWNEASKKSFFGNNELLYQILKEHLSQI
jgi:predicted kinase